jgi:hypothetical protein
LHNTFPYYRAQVEDGIRLNALVSRQLVNVPDVGQLLEQLANKPARRTMRCSFCSRRDWV